MLETHKVDIIAQILMKTRVKRKQYPPNPIGLRRLQLYHIQALMDKPWGWGPLSPTHQSHHSVGSQSQGASGKCLLSSRQGWGLQWVLC